MSDPVAGRDLYLAVDCSTTASKAVIYDPAGHTSIGYEKTHHMNMDYSAWEGFEIDGHVDWVMSRGTVLIDDSGFVGAKSHGQYLKRGLTQCLL